VEPNDREAGRCALRPSGEHGPRPSREAPDQATRRRHPTVRGLSWPRHPEGRSDSAELLHKTILTVRQTIEAVVFVERPRAIVDRVHDDKPATDTTGVADNEFERVHQQLGAKPATVVFTVQCEARKEQRRDLIR